MAVACKRAGGILIRILIMVLIMPAFPVLAQRTSVYSLADLLDSDHHDAFLEDWLLFFNEKGELVRKERKEDKSL